MRKKLRIISLIMLIVAIVFVYCAISNPALGSVFYIFGIKISVEALKVFYKAYISLMVMMFIASFFVKKQ